MEIVQYGTIREAADSVGLTVQKYRSLIDELESCRRRYFQEKGMTEEYAALKKECVALESLIRQLADFGAFMVYASEAYHKREEKITDLFNGEFIPVPRTEFGSSRITGMEAYESLMPFDRQSFTGQSTIQDVRLNAAIEN